MKVGSSDLNELVMLGHGEFFKYGVPLHTLILKSETLTHI